MSTLRDVEAGFRALTLGSDDEAIADRLWVGVSVDRLRAYRTLVRNNVRGTIRRACPHAVRLAGDKAFDAVVDAFLAGWPIQTRLTRDIPGEFTSWLMASTSPSGPVLSLTSSQAFAELCHFEALEIEVTLSETLPHLPGALGARSRLQMDPSTRLAIYSHPVQQVTRQSTALPSQAATPTVLLCFQQAERFEVESISAALGKVLLASVDGAVVDAIAGVVEEGRVSGVVVDAGHLRSALVGLHRRGAIAGFVDG